MKRLLYCLLAVSFLFSCKPKTLREEFTPVVQGMWVKKDYIDRVLKSKSPAANAQMAWDITVLSIDAVNAKKDSIPVWVGKATHELTFVTLFFEPGTKKPHTIQMADTDLGYTIDGKDTIITLYYKLHNKLDSTKYIKVLHNAPKKEVGAGLDTLLNRGLIAGKYNLQENGATKEVEFTVSGKVKGLGAYKTYYVNNDFIQGMHNVDGLTFDMHSSKSSGLAFKIKADTLDLYNTIADEKTELTTLAGLKYHLVRKK